MPKLFIGLTVVLFAAIAILVTPWYPSTITEQATQTLTATLTGSITNYQTVTVYSLPNPVNLPTTSTPPPCPCLIYGYFLSQNFTLLAGSTYTMDVSMKCQGCVVWVNAAFSAGKNLAANGVYTGPPVEEVSDAAVLNSTGGTTFGVPATGPYAVFMACVGAPTCYSGTVDSLSITTSQAQVGEVLQTGYITAGSTVYSRTVVRLYTVLGTLLSLMVLSFVGLVVIIACAVVRIRSHSTGHP